jgi:hypothetical protein
LGELGELLVNWVNLGEFELNLVEFVELVGG